MAELKQIEVNGTTYDIGIPGSQRPVVCEVYDESWPGETIAEKLTGGNAFYREIPSNILLKCVSDGVGDPTLSVVIAIPDVSIS